MPRVELDEEISALDRMAMGKNTIGTTSKQYRNDLEELERRFPGPFSSASNI